MRAHLVVNSWAAQHLRLQGAELAGQILAHDNEEDQTQARQAK